MTENLRFVIVVLLLTLMLAIAAIAIQVVQAEDQAAEIKSLKIELRTTRANLDTCLGDMRP